MSDTPMSLLNHDAWSKSSESESNDTPKQYKGDHGRSPTSGSGAPPIGPLEGVKSTSSQKILSCAECRRLKLKCDREVPCSNCVKRHCKELCPNGIKTTKRSGGLTAQAAEQLQSRLSSLERLLERHGIDIGQGLHSTANDTRSHAINPNGPVKRTLSSDDSYQPPDKRSRGEMYTSDRLDMPHTRRHSEMGYPSSAERHELHLPLPSPSLSSGRPYATPMQNAGPSGSGHGTARSFGSGPLHSPIEHSHGTLVLTQSGSSRYLGPTAGTEWLKNQELDEYRSTSPSPSPKDPQTTSEPNVQSTPHFPFFLHGQERSFEDLLSELPPPDDVEVLVDCYYRYFTWNHDVAPRRSIQPLLNRVLGDRQPVKILAKNIHPQQLALVYMILAIGSLYNLELPQHDPQAEDFLLLSKNCLTKGDFLNHNTMPGVQTLLMMGHYHLETEKGRNGNQAWPLWGLAMRIIVAMGLHRDGGRWNLPFEVVDERRQVFWEAHTIEVFQANCFSRPSCLVPRYIDTAFPAPYPPPDDRYPKAYKTLKYEICQMSARILDMGMGVEPAPYADVHEMYLRLCEFERQIPYHFRCRSALSALPSVYPDPAVAVLESPEPNRRQITQSFQQFTLSLNVSENILYLQRPYFVMAMHDQPMDPTRSIYGHSYLAVVERCNVIIQVVQGLYSLHPTISVRHWFFWYHLFTAAVCVGTLILRNPQSVLAQFALGQIDQAIDLFSAVLKHNPSPSMVQNREWLVRLRQRAVAKISHESHKPSTNDTSPASYEGEEDLELLGWRTRLIEQAGAGAHRATNIIPKPRMDMPLSLGLRPEALPSGSLGGAQSANSPLPPAVAEVLQQHLDYSLDPSMMGDSRGSESTQIGADSSTDLLLHQYWDPMIFSDARTDQGPLPSTNWWSWDSMGLGSDLQSSPFGHGGQ
ncbi:hypothetical protein BD324DRAFT_613935 [Kockovaella imperatae]|uniref:Zn(2)-C6 fungal-type domain-containing protein n=1 Tax=Kockovaella imperatae TaxID=4999 RepID=A0A1Y1UTD2_9TREE|nr:hypothetical protein BD324DRAFT_613935 [Kockovaella imperatae]ORX41278.1 hypothetical protein BD324DRAFT_613935 [Kockovaella imperatae]